MTPATLESLAIRLHRSPDAIITAADRHTLTVQGWLASRAPQAERFAGQGIRASSTGIQVPLLNLALGCDFPPGTADEVLDAEITRVRAFFARRGVPWYWWIGADPHPPDIANRLRQHDLVLDLPLLPAMAAALPAPLIPFDPAIQVWQAATTDDLKAASTIRRTAFRFPADVGLDYFEAMASDWLAGDPARLYLARLADGPAEAPPAALGALIMGEGLPGVYVMATLPEWGRRGLGKAILTRIMADAAAEGHEWIVLTASRFGFPLYQQFGFAHIFDYAIYRLTP